VEALVEAAVVILKTMPDDTLPRWATFIVRLHAEGQAWGWRGEVIHVQTRAVQRFVTLA
jgi:hypothetical protein